MERLCDTPRNPCSTNTTHCLDPVPMHGPISKKSHPHLPSPHPSSFPAPGCSYIIYFVHQSKTISSATPYIVPELDTQAKASRKGHLISAEPSTAHLPMLPAGMPDLLRLPRAAGQGRTLSWVCNCKMQSLDRVSL